MLKNQTKILIKLDGLDERMLKMEKALDNKNNNNNKDIIDQVIEMLGILLSINTFIRIILIN
jgi:hypothetical protein